MKDVTELVRQIGAEEGEREVGEIHQAQQAPRQAQPEGEQRIQSTGQQAGDDRLAEQGGARDQPTWGAPGAPHTPHWRLGTPRHSRGAPRTYMNESSPDQGGESFAPGAANSRGHTTTHLPSWTCFTLN